MLAGSLSHSNLIPDEILAAAARGWKLFPIAAGTKNRALCKWGTEATSDLPQIKSWASTYPNCNWGVATGERSGIFGIDLDSSDALLWAITNNLPMGGYQVKSGKNDLFASHVYFRQPAGVRIKTDSAIAPGVDVRGDGGMLVIPPSIHPSGNRYSILCDAEVAEPPEWLIDLVKDTRPEKPVLALDDLPPLTPDQMTFGRNIFLKHCREFAALPAGQGLRNEALNKLGFTAGGLIASGCFDEEFAEGAMRDHAADYILSERERPAMATWNSGLDAGMGSPWVPPAPAPEDAGFGTGALPPGASLTPVPSLPAPGSMALTPEERIIANTETQEAVARIFAKRMKGQMLYDHTRKAWLRWADTHWEVDELRIVHHFILGISNELNYGNKASMATSSFCDGVNKHLQSFPEFATTSKEFDRDNYLLNTPAGTIDLRTGKMRPHDPADKITLCTVASPEVEGNGAAFRKFMTEITAGDEELIRFHQVSLGACLSGAVEDHWLSFWYGVPRAGKNTLGELVEALMGDYARTIPTSTLMSKKFEGHPTEMANLQGIRLATCSELSDGDHWNEARIKQLTGDSTLSARWIGGNYFEFERTFKLLVYGNYRPQLRSADEALRARLKIVPFNVSFLGREDRGLSERLGAEMGYVLQWLLEGHRQWLEAGRKLPECAAVAAEISHYFEAQSTPQLWLKDCCEILKKDDRPDLQLHTVVECYRSYKTWKEARGESPLSQTRWQPEALHGLETVRTRRGACVRRLRLLPLQHGGVPFPPAASAGETFAEFAARVSAN